MSITPTANAVSLPPGVTIVGSRETSQPSSNGQILQGLMFTLQLPSGVTTTVFIPYRILPNTAAVAAAFQERVSAIQAIEQL
jgi:hypothetical protein